MQLNKAVFIYILAAIIGIGGLWLSCYIGHNAPASSCYEFAATVMGFAALVVGCLIAGKQLKKDFAEEMK